MDGASFDTLTKKLAGTHRRDLLTALTGGFLALLGLGATTHSAAGQRCNDKREACDVDDDCCDDLICRGGECRNDRDDDNNQCADEGERCDRNNDCCDEMECRDRECRGGRNNDNDCSSRGERCDLTDDCCDDLVCRDRECRN